MQIRQMQVASDPIQDRLLLRVATQAQEEIRVFLTRRFLRELWPTLVRTLFGHFSSGPAPAAGKESAPATNYEQPYQNDNPVFPLGSNPLLPAEATVEPAGAELCRLTFREAQERSFTLNLTAELLQGLCSMLRVSNQQAGWDLNLDYGAAPAASGTGAPIQPTRLH